MIARVCVPIAMALLALSSFFPEVTDGAMRAGMIAALMMLNEMRLKGER